jgi:hypothetical protein
MQLSIEELRLALAQNITPPVAVFQQDLFLLLMPVLIGRYF